MIKCQSGCIASEKITRVGIKLSLLCHFRLSENLKQLRMFVNKILIELLFDCWLGWEHGSIKYCKYFLFYTHFTNKQQISWLAKRQFFVDGHFRP